MVRARARVYLGARVQEYGQVAVKTEGGSWSLNVICGDNWSPWTYRRYHTCQEPFVRTIRIRAENCSGVVMQNASWNLKPVQIGLL